MKVIKAIYNFLVGDMIILVGILLVVLLLALIANVAALSPLRVISGPILISRIYSSNFMPIHLSLQRGGEAC
ncbi:MAG: hypothetical protein E6J22_11505 [Chloroflexi bacterium]|nr:MAG: hypothetical protein E6J22_11505 [Chloroflexota bacterium]